jgi:serine protease inhibitor
MPSILDTFAADADVRQLAAANVGFGFRLLKQLNQETPGANFFFSPFSISQALTLTLNGAGGATQASIAVALGLRTLPLERLNSANAHLLPSLTLAPQVQVSVANALWADTGTTFNADFQERCRWFYNAHAETLDFSKLSAADIINGWVKDNTSGRIDRLVSADDLVSSVAVLTNAVYFHGLWSRPFNPAHTQAAPFMLAPGRTKLVPLMAQAGNYSYFQAPHFQAIALPYGEGSMSLYVFLPTTESSLDDFVAGLDENVWAGWMGQMRPTQARIFLPRFQAEFQARLKKPLCALGMASAFCHGADFRPMGLRDDFIGEVIHKSILVIDENGTTASAATAVANTRSRGPNPGITVRVDRPFFCALRDNATGTLLFTGIIREPS